MTEGHEDYLEDLWDLLPTDPTDFLENPPTEDESEKAATSEWCFDHDADVNAHHTKFTITEHDVVARHPLAVLDPLVCSEAEAAVLIAASMTTHQTTYNHANYDTAFGWGDHAGLYVEIGDAYTDAKARAAINDIFGADGKADSNIDLDGNDLIGGDVILPANGRIGVTDGTPQIVFDNVNNYLEITALRIGLGTSTPYADFEMVSDLITRPIIWLKNFSADEFGPEFFFQKWSDTPAAGDELGRLYFRGKDDSGEACDYGWLQCLSTDLTDTHEAGAWQFETKVNGGTQSLLVIDGYGQGAQGAAEVVVNEDSCDCDFRVESNGDTHALFVQGSDSVVRMGSLAGVGVRNVVVDANGNLSAP